MGTLLMSKKERRRFEVLSRVKSGEWTLAMAARSLGLSYRQTKRIWARYVAGGDAGLVHASRGRTSSRRISDELRERALSAMREKYSDFGATLISEYLAKEEKIVASVSTVRRWQRSAGLSMGRHRRSPKHRTRRARKQHFGELVQLDGSRHDWFEGRRGWACLMVMIDDATGQVVARFHEVESLTASMDVFRTWVEKHGLPAKVYPDRHSIYRADREPTIEETLAGKQPRTQFGRALDELGVQLSLAGSPQAKGRVERMNGTLQDRLVKELRLRGIDTLEAANELLESGWMDDLSDRFGVEPKNEKDLHRPAPSTKDLDRVLARWETRQVGRDAVVRWSNRWFQLEQTKGVAKLAGREATMIVRGSQVLAIGVAGLEIAFKELSSAPAKKAKPTGVRGVSPTRRPAKDHCWRKGLPGSRK
jgi:transposase